MKRYFPFIFIIACIAVAIQMPSCSKKDSPATAPANDQPPAVPVLSSPASGDTGVALSPTLAWNVADRATSYNLQVATDSAFTGLVSSFTGINSTMQIVSGLTSTTDYCWRVSAVNNVGTSEWSTSWKFRTRAYVNPWTTKAPMPSAVWAVSGVALNGKVYAVGGASTGSDAFWEYDPALDSWSAKQPMPSAHGAGTAVAAVNGKVYVIGGEGTTATHEYDPSSNAWKTMASMPTYRYYAPAASVDGKIYVLGGMSSSSVYNTVEVFDPVSNAWQTASPMPTARENHMVATYDGKIYAIGGHKTGTHYNIVEVYNPVTASWTTSNPMPTSRRAAGCAAYDGIIYVIGGQNSSTYFNTVEAYNIGLNTWYVKSAMPTGRSTLACAETGGFIYAFGGLTNPYTVTAQHEVYNTSSE